MLETYSYPTSPLPKIGDRLLLDMEDQEWVLDVTKVYEDWVCGYAWPLFGEFEYSELHKDDLELVHHIDRGYNENTNN